MPQTVAIVLTSKDKRLDTLRKIFFLLESPAFWSSVEKYMMLLVPGIERCLVLQGADAVLADVVYCLLR